MPATTAATTTTPRAPGAHRPSLPPGAKRPPPPPPETVIPRAQAIALTAELRGTLTTLASRHLLARVRRLASQSACLLSTALGLAQSRHSSDAAALGALMESARGVGQLLDRDEDLLRQVPDLANVAANLRMLGGDEVNIGGRH